MLHDVCDNAMHQQKQHASLADARASLAVEFFSFINMNLLIRSERASDDCMRILKYAPILTGAAYELVSGLQCSHSH